MESEVNMHYMRLSSQLTDRVTALEVWSRATEQPTHVFYFGNWGDSYRGNYAGIWPMIDIADFLLYSASNLPPWCTEQKLQLIEIATSLYERDYEFS